ncbi:MAG: asparagine synthase (glutamine-hydrolyzing) [Alphaproteobacteria bacterium CG_4_9_14_3_um_filter_47_13]|nr:MAG: asparagine synthase (glutamine-hydrolyzing) [Alphaproteobacteria bacterium CG_4_9_14_3_um_filter_47_13]
MCGITGFFDPEQRLNKLEMLGIGKRMSDSIAKRGPDDEGHWQDPDLALLLGHRRLSIIDLSAEGHQPMESASGRYIIIYNGEVYNFRELAVELAVAPHTFRGRSDTEIMLAAFEKWGVNQTLQKLDGMFAFVLWDRETGMLHFIRDRLGKKPLYIGWAGKTLVFGSELKSLCAHPDFKPQINKQTLTLYMRYGYVPAPHCIYNQVWQIPAGCRISLDLRNLESGSDLNRMIESYWYHPRIVEEAQHRAKPQNAAQAISEFKELLTWSVQQRMVSDVPLGAFLSGGIDSSIIVALMQQNAVQPVKTFTIGFEEAGFNEAAYAKKVAQYLGTEHHELYLTPRDAQDVIPQLPDIFDEPFADVSQIPTLLLSRFARQHVTVALSGDGGDEMLGGYQRHYRVPELWNKVGRFPLPLRRIMGRLITALPEERWDRLVPQQPQFGERLYKVAELLPLQDPEAVYRHLVSRFTAPQDIVKGGSEPVIPLTDPSWHPKGLGFAERMMYGDALSYLPNDILVKVDRASMAASLEARAPLLDRKIFEYVWSLPLEMKIRKNINGNGMEGKWLLRQILQQYLPADLYERPKQGFAMPIGTWLRDPLRDWAEDLLDQKNLEQAGYLDAVTVRALWNDHLQGKGRHADKLWTILMFQSWQKRWM